MCFPDDFFLFLPLNILLISCHPRLLFWYLLFRYRWAHHLCFLYEWFELMSLFDLSIYLSIYLSTFIHHVAREFCRVLWLQLGSKRCFSKRIVDSEIILMGVLCWCKIKLSVHNFSISFWFFVLVDFTIASAPTQAALRTSATSLFYLLLKSGSAGISCFYFEHFISWVL